MNYCVAGCRAGGTPRKTNAGDVREDTTGTGTQALGESKSVPSPEPVPGVVGQPSRAPAEPDIVPPGSVGLNLGRIRLP